MKARMNFDYMKAEVSFRLAIKIASRSEKPQVKIAVSRGQLAAVLVPMGRLYEAEAEAIEALRFFEKQDQGKSISSAEAYCSLGRIALYDNKYTKALEFLTKSLSIYRVCLPDDDNTIGHVCRYCSEACLELGRLKEADAYIQRAIAIMDKALKKRPPTTVHASLADCLEVSARLNLRRKKLPEAEALALRSLALYQEDPFQFERHPYVAYVFQTLANVKLEQAAKGEAEGLLDRALAALNRTFPKGHPDTVEILEAKARLLIERDKPLQAKALIERARAIRERFKSLNQGSAGQAENGIVGTTERALSKVGEKVEQSDP
jgi:tetratricopeptide (TPR) repeat protein